MRVGAGGAGCSSLRLASLLVNSPQGEILKCRAMLGYMVPLCKLAKGALSGWVQPMPGTMAWRAEKGQNFSIPYPVGLIP